jgi:hypothetical protein
LWNTARRGFVTNGIIIWYDDMPPDRQIRRGGAFQ